MLDRLRSLAFFLSSSFWRACVSNLIWDSSNPWSRLLVGSPQTSRSRTVPSYFLGPAGFGGRLAAFDTGRLAGLGLSLGLTAGPAGGPAEDRLSAPVDDFPLLGLITPLIFENIDGLRSSTSGSSASVGGTAVAAGGTAVAAGGGRLDPLSVDFLASFRGETDRIAFLCECWVGIFPPALGTAPVVSFAGSSRVDGGPAGGRGSAC